MSRRARRAVITAIAALVVAVGSGAVAWSSASRHRSGCSADWAEPGTAAGSQPLVDPSGHADRDAVRAQVDPRLDGRGYDTRRLGELQEDAADALRTVVVERPGERGRAEVYATMVEAIAVGRSTPASRRAAADALAYYAVDLGVSLDAQLDGFDPPASAGALAAISPRLAVCFLAELGREAPTVAATAAALTVAGIELVDEIPVGVVDGEPVRDPRQAEHRRRFEGLGTLLEGARVAWNGSEDPGFDRSAALYGGVRATEDALAELRPSPSTTELPTTTLEGSAAPATTTPPDLRQVTASHLAERDGASGWSNPGEALRRYVILTLAHRLDARAQAAAPLPPGEHEAAPYAAIRRAVAQPPELLDPFRLVSGLGPDQEWSGKSVTPR